MKFPLTKRARVDECREALNRTREERDKYRDRCRMLEEVVGNALNPLEPEENFAKKTLARTDLRYFGLRGCMRSGTNWLDSLLSRHPEIECYGEFHLQRLVGPWRDGLSYLEGRHENLLPIEPFLRHPYESAFKLALARQIREQSTRFIGDRTPHSIDPITISDAKYISVVRDGRDVLVSMAFHFLNVANSELEAAHGWTVEDRFPQLASHRPAFVADRSYFKSHPELLLEDEELLRHGAEMWSEIVAADHGAEQILGADRIRVVRYENLHQDPERITRELFEFLGAEPEAAPPLEGSLKPGFEESPGSFYRHGKVGDWRSYFTQKQADDYFRIAGGSLSLYDYAH